MRFARKTTGYTPFKMHGAIAAENDAGSIKNIHLYIFRNLNFVFSVLICRSSVLALGSGQRLLCRLGLWLWLVLVLVLWFCAYSYGGVYS